MLLYKDLKEDVMLRRLALVISINLLLTLQFSIANELNTLFDHPKYQNTKISPDGKYLAVSLLREGKYMLAFIDREKMTSVGVANFTGSYEVGDYEWINNERVVMQMVKREPWLEAPQFYGELYAVNYNGKRGEMIYGYRSGQVQTGSRIKKKEGIHGWGYLIDPLLEDDKHILIQSTPMSGDGERLPTALLLNAYNGKIKSRVARSPVPYARFLTDTKGKLKAVAGTNTNNQPELYIRDKSEWLKVPNSKLGSGVVPLAISDSGKHLYTIDNHNQDLKGIFKLNLDTYDYTELFTDKATDITHVEMTSDGRTAMAIRVDEDYPAYIVLNKKHEEAKVYRNILKSFPYNKVEITSSTRTGSHYVVRVSSDVNPGSFFLFDKEENSLKLLFNSLPQLKPTDFVQVEPIKFKASDNTTLHGYFTPAKNTKDIAPLVVLVHGGPHGVRDYWGFSSYNQFLSHNGYSVLQVNYRGSAGYGNAFKTAGHRKWGTRIQQDILEAYQYLIAQNKAAPNSACIMGASFGGYSAIQSVAAYPDAYKCAVANAGIYDLELMFEEGDIQRRQAGLSYLREVLGTEESILKSMSPVNYVEKIKVPLLLAHGKDDERAPFEHVERLRAALDSSNISYDWFVLDKEEHGFFNPENQRAYMNRVLSFLDKHLG